MLIIAIIMRGAAFVARPSRLNFSPNERIGSGSAFAGPRRDRDDEFPPEEDLDLDPGHAPHGEDDALGVENDADLELDGGVGGGSDDSASDDLEIGEHDLALKDGHVDGPGAHGDEHGPGADSTEEFVPSFSDAPPDGGDEPHPEIGHEMDDDALPSTADDGGAEGIGDGSESFVDESALPAMDADAGGDFELPDLLEELGFGGDGPWELLGTFSTELRLSAVTCREGTLVAVGSAALVVDRGAPAPRVRALAEPAIGCAIVDGSVALATRRGVELLELPSTSPARAIVERPDVQAVAFASGQLWALAGSTLLKVDLASGRAAPVRDDVRSIGAAQGTLFVVDGSGLLRLRGGDGAFEAISLDETARRFIGGDTTIAASSPSALLLMKEGRALVVSSSGSSTSIPREGLLAGTFRAAVGIGQGELATALLVAEAVDGGLDLVSASGAGDGTATTLLHVGPERARADASERWGIAWDATREIAVVAGPNGLFSMRPRVEH